MAATGEHPLVVHAPQAQLLLHDIAYAGQPGIVAGQPEDVDVLGWQPVPVHDPHPGQVQLLVHVWDWVPQFPQPWDCVWPGAHAPCPEQLPKAPQVQLELHVCVCVPQFPHPCDCVAPGEQTP